jgi:NOL1/NOP2/fmu family ribosome biogenesis protein
VKPLNSKERKAVREQLREQYGYTGDFDYTVFVNDEGKHYVGTRDVEPFIDSGLRIERIGIYVFALQHGEIRMSIEGSQLFGPACTNGILDITQSQRDEWLLGKDLSVPTETEQRFYIVRCEGDYLGGGKAKHGLLLNHVPKERYIGAAFTDEDALA